MCWLMGRLLLSLVAVLRCGGHCILVGVVLLWALSAFAFLLDPHGWATISGGCVCVLRLLKGSSSDGLLIGSFSLGSVPLGYL